MLVTKSIDFEASPFKYDVCCGVIAPFVDGVVLIISSPFARPSTCPVVF
jgi:hypothetical protein